MKSISQRPPLCFEWQQDPPLFGVNWWRLSVDKIHCGTCSGPISHQGREVFMWSVGEPGDCCKVLSHGVAQTVEQAMAATEESVRIREEG
jgi:hypothetical protein